MKNRRLILNVLLVAGLWFANDVLTSAKGYPRCFDACNEWVGCSQQCYVRNETLITCGQSGYPCFPD